MKANTVKSSRADFHYQIVTVDGRSTLIIIDQDLGNKSVTNDIENVVNDTLREENLNLTETTIIYRDSEGKWAGWHPITDSFYPVQPPILLPVLAFVDSSTTWKAIP